MILKFRRNRFKDTIRLIYKSMIRRSFLSISNNTKIKRLYPFSKKINFLAKKNLFSTNNKKVKEDEIEIPKLIGNCMVTGSIVGFILGINDPFGEENESISSRLGYGLSGCLGGTFAGGLFGLGLYITPPILCIYIGGRSIIYINDMIFQ